MQVVVKSHYTAPELAMLGLPGVPTTEQGVRYSATREKWAARRRTKGKGLEYALDSLPAEAQAAIRRRASAALVTSVPAQPAKAVIRREQPLMRRKNSARGPPEPHPGASSHVQSQHHPDPEG